MGKITIYLILVSLLLITGCLLKSTVYLNGNREAINATIYIDSKEVGNMKEINGAAEAQIKVKAGQHYLKIVNLKGEIFEKNFYVKGEIYIGVVFSNRDSTATST